MTMLLEVDGVPYENWDNASATVRMDSMSGVFQFNATATNVARFPIKRGAPVRVLVDDKPVITGFVDKITISISPDSHSISIQGRDRTCDIIDSTLDGSFVFHSTISLENVIRRVMKFLGYTGEVVNTIAGLAPFSATEIVASQVGDNAFEFLMKCARKRQVLLASDGKGNIVIQRASNEVLSVQLENIYGGTRNNIKQSQVTFDESHIFQQYTVHSQGNTASKLTWDQATVADTVSRSGSARDSSVKRPRILHIKERGSYTNGQCISRAAWEVAARQARSFTYNCTVAGHSFEGPSNAKVLWKPNQLIQVIDEAADISATLRITAVTYKTTLEGGSESDLELVSRDSYALDEQEDERKDEVQAKKRKKGDKNGQKLVW